MKVEYYYHFFTIFLLVCLLIVVFVIVNVIPKEEKNKFNFLYSKKPFLFFMWIGLIITTTIFTTLITASSTMIEMREPFSQPGVFLFTLVILLLTDFFVITGGTNYSTIYESHPSIFVTSIFLIVMVIINSIGVNIKLYTLNKASYS